MFQLHDRLAADTVEIDRWALSRVLLMNDSNYPWLVLVPEREGLRDLHDLAPQDHAPLMAEIARASRALQAIHSPHKLNVAALGNVVPQLHVHVIARFTTDAAWPRPVWGVAPPKPYGEAALAEALQKLKAALG
jgi:diadenosine tetraphosphate (Ap4A) HIT family hydrolase